ncbi:MAG: methyltransferase [Thaumarchaeota archaeon]|nr:MAG: methyltransferase [Nitrososphaerota archaeon]
MNKKISQVLRSLEKRANYQQKNYSKIHHDKRMLAITKDTGIFYNLLLRIQKPKKILEIGTSFGYSTLWFADAMSKNSKIITIEKNPKKIKFAKNNFHKAGVANRIEIKEGIARDVLIQLSKSKLKTQDHFDFIFIDADKEEYPFYFDICLPMLKKNGIIAADNIIFPKRFKKHIKKYLNHIRGVKSVKSITFPIGNGQELSFKI